MAPALEVKLDIVSGFPEEEGRVRRRATTSLATLDNSSKDKVKTTGPVFEFKGPASSIT